MKISPEILEYFESDEYWLHGPASRIHRGDVYVKPLFDVYMDSPCTSDPDLAAETERMWVDPDSRATDRPFYQLCRCFPVPYQPQTIPWSRELERAWLEDNRTPVTLAWLAKDYEEGYDGKIEAWLHISKETRLFLKDWYETHLSFRRHQGNTFIS